MRTVQNAAYAGPVARLLTIGRRGLGFRDTAPDYMSEIGLSRDDIPALIRLGRDEALRSNAEDEAATYGPVHAWCALGQLRAEEAVEPLLMHAMTAIDLTEDDEACRFIPHAIGMIGAPALAPAARLVANPDKMPWSLGIVLTAFEQIVERHPECRTEVIDILVGVLQRHRNADRNFNGSVLSSLLGFEAVEAIEAIRGAFAADAIDSVVVGDLEDAEIALGFRKERSVARPKDPMGKLVVDTFKLLFDEEDSPDPLQSAPVRRAKSAEPGLSAQKLGRNDPCPCGSGKKYKKCCLR